MKHVVVEGPDGAGKTNLVNELVDHLGIPLHPRFVQSTGGPPRDLDIRVMQDFNSPLYGPDNPQVYDRHPVISEPIYGPIVRGELRGMFQIYHWVNQYRQLLAERAIVVFCLPPIKEVLNNVGNPDVEQMEGVTEESITKIYRQYTVLATSWPPFLIHDYTINPPGSENRRILISRIRHLMKEDHPSWI